MKKSTIVKKTKSGAKDWRSETLARVRRLIKQADPDAIEEVKWRKPSNPAGVPVWSHDGIICTGESYKKAVKLTFANGASLKDPARRLENERGRGQVHVRQGHEIDRSLPAAGRHLQFLRL